MSFKRFLSSLKTPAVLKAAGVLFFTVLLSGRFTPGFDHMPDSCHGMHEKHPRSGESHHRPDPFPHVGFVAVHLAVGAKGLGLHKGTFITAHSGIFFQFRAFRTKLCFPESGSFAHRFVLFLAVEQDHIGDHLLLPLSLVLYLFCFLYIIRFLLIQSYSSFCIFHVLSRRFQSHESSQLMRPFSTEYVLSAIRMVDSR